MRVCASYSEYSIKVSRSLPPKALLFLYLITWRISTVHQRYVNKNVMMTSLQHLIKQNTICNRRENGV